MCNIITLICVGYRVEMVPSSPPMSMQTSQKKDKPDIYEDRKTHKTRMKYARNAVEIFIKECIQSNFHWCHCSRCVSVILFFSFLLYIAFSSQCFAFSLSFSSPYFSFYISIWYSAQQHCDTSIPNHINMHESSFLLTCIRFSVLFWFALQHFKKG